MSSDSVPPSGCRCKAFQGNNIKGDFILSLKKEPILDKQQKSSVNYHKYFMLKYLLFLYVAYFKFRVLF